MFKSVTTLINNVSHLYRSYLASLKKPVATSEVKGLRVGVWAGRAAMADPEQAVSAMVRLGVTSCYIMLNDFSDRRHEECFTADARAVELARLCDLRSISVHLTTWVMPHEGFIRSMCKEMPEIIKQAKAHSVLFDAEEPWTQAVRHQGYNSATGQLRAGLEADPWGVPLGITGIGHASKRKLGSLAGLCDYLVPQAYSTRTSGVDCRTAGLRFARIWRKKFGDKEIRMGLAAYRQRGVKGSNGSPYDAMTRAIASVPNGVHEVIFWWLPTLKNGGAAADVISGIGRGGEF